MAKTITIRDFARHYVLDAKHRVVPADVLTWARFFEDDGKRQVCLDWVGALGTNRVMVSTVFTGLPSLQELVTKPPLPLVFESRVFGGKLDTEVDHYACWDEAVAGHAALLSRVIAAENAS